MVLDCSSCFGIKNSFAPKDNKLNWPDNVFFFKKAKGKKMLFLKYQALKTV